MKLRHLLLALLVVACGGDGEVVETPPVGPATTTTVEATTSTSLPGATVDEVLQATAELETYRFTWKTTIDELDVDPVESTTVGLVGGAIDRNADAMVWRIDYIGMIPDSRFTYTAFRSDDRYFLEGLPYDEGDETPSGFLETTDLSAFPKPFVEPELEPARLPAFYFSWSSDAAFDGDRITGTIDPATLSDDELSRLQSALDVGTVPHLEMEAELSNGTVSSIHLVQVDEELDLRTIVDITIEPADAIEFPDVDDPAPDPESWMNDFLEAFIAGNDLEAVEMLDQMSDVIDDRLAVPDVSGLTPPESFCAIYGNIPYRWSTDALFPSSLWLDHARAATGFAPDEIVDDFAVLLGFWEDRLEWQFTGGERPPFSDAMEAAERRVSRWAVDACDLPQIPGPTPDYDGYSEWVCDFERRSIAEAQDAYYAEFGTYADHLHILETHTTAFFGADHVIIDSADDSGYEVIVIEGGACDGP